jgi:putative DNA-invertase from lambdoid prophage Rac
MNDIKRVAIYARVSTGEQDPEVQVRELHEYAERRGWKVVKEPFVDYASGKLEKRPALDLLMRDAGRKAFDAVLVWKLDRFGRSLRHLINALAELEARGVAFVSLSDNLDLSTPAGRLMFQIIGAMAEFERTLISERVSAGLRNARAKGHRLGRPKRQIDVSQVRRMQGFGMSQNAIIRELRTTGRTLRNALRADVHDAELLRHLSEGKYDA